MPRITVEMLEGRTMEQKRALAKEICDAVAEIFKLPTSGVAVRLMDVSFEDFACGSELYCDTSLREGKPVYGGGADPRITTQFFEGRSIEEKRALVKRLTEITAKILCIPPDKIKIFLHEMKDDQFSIGGTLHCDAK
ncbi:tautomerase family protein [Marasmitruncus massiliensis]|uniref:tautomerase family protein n=1 Tax=Marasmitruncus massiliensis TaxID=1944642 RepID=UPI001A9A4FEB|nr:tautomerase family protein [Marasmitruncus massiliensis]